LNFMAEAEDLLAAVPALLVFEPRMRSCFGAGV